jgi:hypothetical protein
MSILDKLKSQPRWKNADPAVRLEAIKDVNDPVELALLAETDPDARVRRAVVGQLDDPVVLTRVASGDTDQEAQDRAAERLFALATTGVDGTALAAVEAIQDPKRLSAVAKSGAPEAVCLSALARTTDERALASIARQAVHASVAAAAVARLAGRENWLDVALNAEHKDVALLAFERLASEAIDLEELRGIEKRTSQKPVARRARTLIQEIEAAEAARLAAEAEHRNRQLALCDAVERLTAVSDAAAARGELTQLAAAWSGLDDVDAELGARFATGAAAAEMAIVARERDAEEAADLARRHSEAVATCEALCARTETLEGDDVLAQLVPIEEEWRSLAPLVGDGPEAARLGERFARAVAACRKRHEMGTQLTDASASFEALVAEAESLPSHDDAGAAAARWAVLSREARGLTALLSAASRPAPADLVDRLRAVEEVFTGRDAARRQAAAQAQQDLLAQFQRLIERAERVAEADSITLREGDRLMRDIKLALDALPAGEPGRDLDQAASRVRKLQEQVAPRVHELREMDEWRRFANAQQQEKLIAMAEAIVASLRAEEEAGQPSDLAATARALRELHAKWHEAAEAPRNVAQRLWDRFRTATDDIRSRCAGHFAKLREERADNLRKKNAIVEQAEALVTSSDWVKTAERYRELQAEWQATGPVPREAARELFQRLRTASNAFFARRREDLSSRKKVWSENLARKEALCARAEELAASTEWDAAAAEIKRLQSDWKTIGPVRRKQSDAVWARFRAAADTFFERYHNRHQIALAGKLAEREAWVVEIEQLAVAENGHVPADLVERVHNLRTTWNRSVPVPVPEMKALTVRWQTALGQLVEKRPDAFAGTDLDPKAVVKKMEKLVARVESLIEGESAPASGSGQSQAELLAARLRSALATNAMGGRAHESSKWRGALDSMHEAQDAWRRLAPVQDADARALESRFTAACRRVADLARQHGVEYRRPAKTGPRRTGRPAEPAGRRPRHDGPKRQATPAGDRADSRSADRSSGEPVAV